jgi:hypothetical protein
MSSARTALRIDSTVTDRVTLREAPMDSRPRPMKILRVLLVFGCAFGLGCSSSDKTSEPGDTGSSQAAELDAAAAEDAGDETATDAAPTELKAPTLDELMKMSGALHVMWTNNQACDSVVAERKTDTTEYKQLFSVKGTIDNKMDGAATANVNYTYRLRCRVGEAYSPYSNELTKNPTK